MLASAAAFCVFAQGFYQQEISVSGFVIRASSKVSPEALKAAKDIVSEMLSLRPAVLKKIVREGIRGGVIGRTEQTTDIPEYSDLPKAFPETDWNARARGLGATRERPVISAGEENLLGLKGDRYQGESIFVHEFAHVIMDFGLGYKERKSIQVAFDQAKAEGLWQKTYAITNPSEYWAEGVQSYFDCNLSASPPNGIHNQICTRPLLKGYDPRLYSLIEKALGKVKWTWNDPAKGQISLEGR